LKTIPDLLTNISKGRQSFTFLLAVLVFYVFALLPFLDQGFTGRLLFMIFYFIFLSSGLNFLESKRKTGIVILFILAPIVILISDKIFNLAWLSLGEDLLIIIYCIWLASIILKRTFSKGHITANRVQGAIIVYLLSALIFAMLYHLIFLLLGSDAFHGQVNTKRSEFMYFSICTLTTLGYGDISPVSAYARTLSNLEAVIGQLYPAILIARLVSMEFAVNKD
jgi:hypothetical protein